MKTYPRRKLTKADGELILWHVLEHILEHVPGCGRSTWPRSPEEETILKLLREVQNEKG